MAYHYIHDLYVTSCRWSGLGSTEWTASKVDTTAVYFGHSLGGQPEAQWEPLDVHLHRVALGDPELGLAGAADFAAAFGARDWGRLAGQWHDLGKYAAEFQSYIRSETGDDASLETLGGKRVDHSTAGAQHAAASLPGIPGRLLAYCIAGHHGGLPDNIDEHGASGLTDRLTKPIPDWSNAPPHLVSASRPAAPSFRSPRGGSTPDFACAFFCRMLFSCLVDADYLATEAFLQPDRRDLRRHAFPTIESLLAALNDHLAGFTDRLSSVNQARARVLEECRAKSAQPRGHFSLTVPTGGGKTLSSLAFALAHARTHRLRRVIYAIPFTSIIEQNADVFRRALGALSGDAMIEHHSNLDPARETVWGRLAAENWDAPLIVTTNVQLFESLFANRPSQCRKLHRIARSVIVLDECQTMPVALLRPTLAALDELVRNYGCSVVLCTATQPAIRCSEEFPIGLPDVREIIADPPALASGLKRTKVEHLGKLADEALIERLEAVDRVLCVVNTKRHAAELFSALSSRQPTGTYHLSTNMCPAHRSDVLAAVRRRLIDGEPCRVVSTQLIEAGVDVDFPVVFRAEAGLDSITQAAGRCNRDGKLPVGRVFLFATDVRPPSDIAQCAQTTAEVMGDFPDLLGLDAIEQYFRLRYWIRRDEWDKHGIMSMFQLGKVAHFQFREAAAAYQIIPDATHPILVPYSRRGETLLRKLRNLGHPPGREFARELQRFTVSLYERQFAKLVENGVVTLLHDQYWVLMNGSGYDAKLGLVMDGFGWDPEPLIA